MDYPGKNVEYIDWKATHWAIVTIIQNLIANSPTNSTFALLSAPDCCNITNPIVLMALKSLYLQLKCSPEFGFPNQTENLPPFNYLEYLFPNKEVNVSWERTLKTHFVHCFNNQSRFDWSKNDNCGFHDVAQSGNYPHNVRFSPLKSFYPYIYNNSHGTVVRKDEFEDDKTLVDHSLLHQLRRHFVFKTRADELNYHLEKAPSADQRHWKDPLLTFDSRLYPGCASTVVHAVSKGAAAISKFVSESLEASLKMSWNISATSGNASPESYFPSNSTVEGDTSGFVTLSLVLWAIATVLMVIMSLLTTLGNMLVIISFVYDIKLRTVSNYYILNLAIADFLIGSFCIPLYIPSILWGEWRLGRTLCKLFTLVDNVVCSASVLNIMLISSDRYLSVIHAMSYRVDQTPRKAVLKMLAVWTVAFIIYGPSTLFWEYFVGERIVGPNECLPEFYRNFPYTFSVAVVEFIIPLVSVSFINLTIYLNIKSRSEKMRRNQLGMNELQGAAATILKDREARNLKRDKKAARALAVIVGAFSLSWAPFTVCNLIRTLWPSFLSPTLFELTFWLLWLNSTVNPFLYPYCHPHFRQTFEELIVSKMGCVCLKRCSNQPNEEVPRGRARGHSRQVRS